MKTMVKPKPSPPPPVTSHALSFDGGKSQMVFASVRPQSGKTLAGQMRDICKQLDVLLQRHGLKLGDIVKEVVFLPTARGRSTSHRLLRDYFSGVLPTTSFVLQPPADGGLVALEILAIAGEGVRIENISEHVTVVRDTDCRWAYVGGVEPLKEEKDTYAQAMSGFSQMRRHLEKAGFHFDQVVRTWLYERDITAWEKDLAGAKRQRYQILNDARRQFFTKGNGGRAFSFFHDLPPASTGIGMSDGSFVMECLALDVPKGTIEISPLKNPEQIDAHAYSQEVLERGAAAIKAAPLFSRGMSIHKDYRMLLISGTASIKGQKTVCLDDPEGQTRTTLENIALVLGQAQASLKDVQQVRAYIKNSHRKEELCQRIEKVKQVVGATLPGIPALFLIGDVCRDNLLVEIEALSFVKTAGAKPERRPATRARLAGRPRGKAADER